MDSVLLLVEKGPTSRNSFVMGFVMILEKNKYERNKLTMITTTYYKKLSFQKY